MRRPLSFALLILGIAPTAIPQSGLRDRYFTRYPFDKWKSEGPASQIHWNPKALPAKLSAHQRLLTRVEFLLDSKETEKRRGHGELVVFLELTDSAERHWRTHEAFNLDRVPEGAKAQQVSFAQDAFILPGDYKLALAIVDSQTQEHSFTELPVHVAPVHSDPLPDVWRDLPAVEFVREFPAPDSWYQPYLRGKIRIPVETHRPVHLDILMNMTPSERASGSVRVFRRNMTVLIPALKVLSGISPTDGSLDVSLIDLTRQRTWEQHVSDLPGHQFDWFKFREPFASNNPGIIDIQSLSAKAEMLQFFRDTISEKLRAHGGDIDKDANRAVIVLSAPVFLEQQHKHDMSRIEKDPHRRLFYIRDRPLPPLMRPPFPSPDGSTQPMANSIASDDCEGVVKSLGGKVYNVLGPEQFRKALASIITEISRM